MRVSLREAGRLTATELSRSPLVVFMSEDVNLSNSRTTTQR